MRRDLVCALTLLAVAVLYWGLTSRIGETFLSDEIGAAGMPSIYAGVLAVLGALLCADVLLRHWLARGTQAEPSTDSIGPGRRLGRAAGALAIGAGYLVLVPFIGYPFAVALAIAAMAAYQGASRDLRLMLIAAAGAAFMFTMFELVLGIPMPAPWNP